MERTVPICSSTNEAFLWNAKHRPPIGGRLVGRNEAKNVLSFRNV